MKRADLGDEVICKITGMRGIVVSFSRNITGCDRLFVQPQVGKDGKLPDGFWMDVDVAKILKAGKVKPSSVVDARPSVDKPGGPMSRTR